MKQEKVRFDSLKVGDKFDFNGTKYTKTNTNCSVSLGRIPMGNYCMPDAMCIPILEEPMRFTHKATFADLAIGEQFTATQDAGGDCPRHVYTKMSPVVCCLNNDATNRKYDLEAHFVVFTTQPVVKALRSTFNLLKIGAKFQFSNQGAFIGICSKTGPDGWAEFGVNTINGTNSGRAHSNTPVILIEEQPQDYAHSGELPIGKKPDCPPACSETCQNPNDCPNDHMTFSLLKIGARFKFAKSSSLSTVYRETMTKTSTASFKDKSGDVIGSVNVAMMSTRVEEEKELPKPPSLTFGELPVGAKFKFSVQGELCTKIGYGRWQNQRFVNGNGVADHLIILCDEPQSEVLKPQQEKKSMETPAQLLERKIAKERESMVAAVREDLESVVITKLAEKIGGEIVQCHYTTLHGAVILSKAIVRIETDLGMVIEMGTAIGHTFTITVFRSKETHLRHLDKLADEARAVKNNDVLVKQQKAKQAEEKLQAQTAAKEAAAKQKKARKMMVLKIVGQGAAFIGTACIGAYGQDYVTPYVHLVVEFITSLL